MLDIVLINLNDANHHLNFVSLNVIFPICSTVDGRLVVFVGCIHSFIITGLSPPKSS